MRISDWSSDVCSSDLLTTLLAANLGAVAAMMLVLWGISIMLRDVSFIDSFWAFGFVLIGCVTIRLYPFGGMHQWILTVLTVVWGFRLGLYLLWRWRSEEHTSELQSLMRISYAVFCLKKKK